MQIKHNPWFNIFVCLHICMWKTMTILLEELSFIQTKLNFAVQSVKEFLSC